ncbi:enoyl-CoA hydratase/isomerase family protein [Pseudomonas sp. PDM24]|uniref:enoyl-CoA hydratase/isomerase family protein n=1 Tax=Pseudomonas sp. PDM24 TaxID=2854777 RepID=UPI001C440610|nr:enoyl-CoA hydratase/isomerase family protein [Pseudomonas sp. PDM24]MBV7495080.1 enoyl-CoA hydratase/isomerase family protein [Pseudomonas sp. PDM24]
MPIQTQRHGDVVEITLDWPEVRNALGPSEGRELRLALEAANADDSVAAVVLSANGKAFCAGGNLPEIVRLAEQGASAVEDTIYGEFQGVFRAIRECPVPFITAVDGAAVGFGCDLALAGSATFIGDRGWIAQGWIKAGLIPATGGTHYVVRRGGQQVLWRLLLADRVDGPTAETWGLAIACPQAREAALEMAAKYAAFPRAPLKALTHLARLAEPEEHLAAALRYQIGFLTDPGFALQAQRLLNP